MWFLNWCKSVACFGLVGVFCLLVSLLKNPYGILLVEGEKVDAEYYLYSPSSQAKICDSVSLAEYVHLTGEKMEFAFSSEAEAASAAASFLQERAAKIVCVEEVAEVRSIYAYVKGGYKETTLFGKKVNLHVVVSGKMVRVGIPIIFGGY